MENGIPPVRVLGIGHLAAAVRVCLQQLRLFASHVDFRNNSESAALFLACSDFENIVLRRSLASRARADGTTLLFACLEGHRARLGPLITPLSRDPLCSHYLTRSWDFSRTDIRESLARVGKLPPHLPDTTQLHLAQIGATFIIGELANLLLDFHQVTKIDSPTDLGDCSPQVFPETHPGTLVVTSAWQEHFRLPTRTWHPTGI